MWHDGVIKWQYFSRYWPFVRGIHRLPVNSPHKDQWRGALMFSLICARVNGWANTCEAGDLRRHRSHCDVIIMRILYSSWVFYSWYIPHSNHKRNTTVHISFQGQFIENLYYGSPEVLIPYDLVRTIILLSRKCEYVLKIECHSAVDRYSWWVDYNGAKVSWTDSAGTFCKAQGKYWSHRV